MEIPLPGSQLSVECPGGEFELVEYSESPATPFASVTPAFSKRNRGTPDTGSAVAASHWAWRATKSFPTGPKATAGQT